MSQKPLEGIPDVDHLDSSEKDNLSLNHMSEKPEQSQKNQTSVPVAAASISIPGSTARSQYLKEEHELKIKILQVDLSKKWRDT
ncbi:hypothetical protein AMECASPLE_020142 [Ameca splendens]|uniref:Uncharacterized protein n=1 Tax=Ameca splendens TaxID=208324 RepID=A0ABV1ACS9_9TELE